MYALELLASRLAFRARLLERALHDAGPWCVVSEGWRYEASRQVLDDGVVFKATIPTPAGRPFTIALACGSDEVSYRDIDVAGDVDVDVVWELTTRASVARD